MVGWIIKDEVDKHAIQPFECRFRSRRADRWRDYRYAINLALDTPTMKSKLIPIKEIPVTVVDPDQFYACLGRCIAAWASIDSSLFALCKIVLKTDQRKTSIIFYRSPSISDHLALISRLMDTHLSDESEVARWSHIKKKIEKHIQFRNHIAHNPVAQVFVGNIKGASSGPHVLTEPAKKAGTKKPLKEYTIKHLEEHLRQVNILDPEIGEFVRDLQPKP